MKLESRGLPEKASNAGDSDGVAENRRVEILSDSWEIMEPVMTNDTIRRVTPQIVRFRPQVASEAGIAQWRIEARQNDKMLATMSGEGDVPATLDWKVDAGTTAIPRAADPIVYALTAQDRAGRSVTTPLSTIGVAQITIRKKRQEQVADKAIDRYSLILFDFDKAELNGGNLKIADFIRERLGPESTVSVTGYTDRIGDADHNRRLSEARARAMASALGLTSAHVQGVGEANLYDNTLPEGRFYSRTVIVEAEHPLP
jgi:outer membrane protein OmpA-like peptidoglycan-associated protein